MSIHSSSHSHSHSHSHSSMRSHSSIHSRTGSNMHSMGGHRSSLASRTNRMNSRAHSSPFKHHGISNAHAFAVGKSTGININGSAMGAHGAALHHSRAIRNSTMSSRARRNRSSISKTNTIKRYTKSNSRKRYTFDTNKYGRTNMFDENLNALDSNYSNSVGIVMFIAMIMMIFMFAIVMIFMFRFMSL